jgi:lipopolysaccharide transport system ATP-binding protein
LSHGKLIFDGEVEEGIDKYMGANQLEFPAVVDLASCKGYTSSIYPLKLTSIEFLNDDISQLSKDEPLRFKLSVQSKKQFHHAKMRMIIHAHDGTPLGIALCEDEMSIEIGNMEMTFCSNLSELAPGVYKLTLVLFRMNDFGVQDILASVNEACSFVKAYSSGAIGKLQWKRTYWGHVFFKPIQLLQS